MHEEEELMAKTNAEAVDDYHRKLRDIKIHVPKKDEERNIPDYVAVFREQAKLVGKDSLNQYFLDLVENDIRTNPDGLYDPDFAIIKGLRDTKK